MITSFGTLLSIAIELIAYVKISPTAIERKKFVETFLVDNKRIKIESLRYKKKETQIKVMRDWFFDNFEDPVNSCPYISQEGGYIYIYGGPYEADEELKGKFEGFVKDSYIEEVIDDLQDICYEWSGKPDAIDWYDEDLYDVVTSSKEPHVSFLESINNVKTLSLLEIDSQHKPYLLGILYTNVITILETLFVELFTISIEKDRSYLVSYIEKGSAGFKPSKNLTAGLFSSNSLMEVRSELLKEVKSHLIDSSWHNIEQVIKRYKLTFDIKVQADWPIKEIEHATIKRNHLIHRGGKDKDGNPVLIVQDDLNNILNFSQSLGDKLNSALHKAISEKIGSIEEEF